MPALLTIVNNGNSDQGDDARWRAGEAVNNLDGHVFGYLEIPKHAGPARTVADVNGMDLSTTDAYLTFSVTDSGTITEGYRTDGLGPIDVEAGDTIVLQFNDTDKFWTAFGPRDAATHDIKHRYHWRVSDKTTAEMQAYMDSHHKEIEMTVVNGPDPQGFRRIEILNLYVTASGNNSWVQENVDEFIAEWNDRYPTCNLQEYQPFTADTVFVEGTFTQGQADEFALVVVQFGLDDLYARRRWYINSQGMQALANNEGFLNTTAQELGPVFRDGLLD